MSTQKRLVVLGGGESGTGAALLAKQKGYAVFLSDGGELKDQYRQLLVEQGIPFEEKGHTEESILAADEVIKSPGIPPTVPLVQKLLAKGTPVIDELAFALRYTEAKVIAITGTNGKTTTTLLTYHLLKEGGLQVGLGGNVGQSLAAQLAEGMDYDWWVLEVSSFQLDGMPGFAPHTGILLNITPDHLDRYEGSFDKYVASKMQLVRRMGPSEAFIYNADDEAIRAAMLTGFVQAHLLPVSETDGSAAAWLEEDKISVYLYGETLELAFQELSLKGKHNQFNAACASLAAMRAGVAQEAIKQGLASFKNAPHRLEKIADVTGVEWINDSKATNVDATWYALEAMEKPVIWIAGGTDKGNDYTQLLPFTKKIKALVAMGKDNSKLLQAFQGKINILHNTHSLAAAMQAAQAEASAGDVVLLSPACASFDLFKNYIDRGDQFREAVKSLATKPKEA